MNELRCRSRRLVPWAALGAILVASGCARVKPEDLDQRLAEIRADMRRGDEENASAVARVGQRVDGLDQRVDGLERRVSALERDLEALRREFGATVERLEASLAFVTPIHFAYDEAEIRAEDRPFLDRFASVIRQRYSDATITVEGFADPAGSQVYNVGLGQRRADTVRTYLIDRGGLDAARVRSVSYGEAVTRLVLADAHGPGEPGLENRRAVLVIDFVPRAGAIATGAVAP